MSSGPVARPVYCRFPQTQSIARGTVLLRITAVLQSFCHRPDVYTHDFELLCITQGPMTKLFASGDSGRSWCKEWGPVTPRSRLPFLCMRGGLWHRGVRDARPSIERETLTAASGKRCLKLSCSVSTRDAVCLEETRTQFRVPEPRPAARGHGVAVSQCRKRHALAEQRTNLRVFVFNVDSDGWLIEPANIAQ